MIFEARAEMIFELRRSPLFELSGSAVRRGLKWNGGAEPGEARAE